MYSHDKYAHLKDAILDALKSTCPARIIDTSDFPSNDRDLDDITIIRLSNLFGIRELLEDKIALLDMPSEQQFVHVKHDEIFPINNENENGIYGLSDQRYRGAVVGVLIYRRDKINKNIVACNDWVKGSGQYEQVLLSLMPGQYKGRIKNLKPKQLELF